MSDLDTIIADLESYDAASRDILKSLKFAGDELAELQAMKRTEGWKILNENVREVLHTRINTLIKDDPQVVVLVALLKVADTKSRKKILDQEIAAILPDQ